jgi:hypothetical protein
VIAARIVWQNSALKSQPEPRDDDDLAAQQTMLRIVCGW